MKGNWATKEQQAALKAHNERILKESYENNRDRIAITADGQSNETSKRAGSGVSKTITGNSGEVAQ
ncbi:hypothetical protein DSM106972_056590 [Dulcicalothrix desertica PCC 7102]|uniref:Uncharacterized protein n=1 Tax=Dulcicalothrix desertica PCC 7102 TaxID=232991 RepID=A0A3S1IUN9_9CYAN|nr:hypothetical protein DSM106972_056590 [Dulcicalothrix desertica PCC 7102]